MDTSTLLGVTDNGLADVPKVVLGEHEYTIYPQRHAYLTNRLGRAMAKLQDASAFESEALEGAIAMLGDRAYDLLLVFIPKLMPEYEWAGYPTQEAFEAKDYNEEYDKSPSFPQIVNAFHVCLNVNRLDLLKHLGKVVNLDLVRAYMTKIMADFFEGQQTRSSVGTASDSTSSGA
jgi:hypothetical protein